MKNILLISFALLVVGACCNPVADDNGNTTSGTCTAGGCSETGCASDCTCGCSGAGGDDCTCSTNCVCSTTCAGGACSADGCGVDCPCGCSGEGGGDCSCSVECNCFVDDSSDDTTLNIWYNNNSSPTISVGDIVIWTNAYGSTHTVTSDGGIFDSGDILSGQTFQYQFDSVGEFAYHCDFHPTSMKGSVTVTQ